MFSSFFLQVRGEGRGGGRGDHASGGVGDARGGGGGFAKRLIA